MTQRAVPQGMNNSDLRRVIGEMYIRSRDTPINAFKQVCFELIRRHVHFVSGSWLIGEHGIAFTPHSLHLHNLEKAFAPSVRRCWHEDTLSRAALRETGRSADLCESFTTVTEESRRVFDRHCQRFQIAQGLSHAEHDERTGLHTLISIYHAQTDRPFTAEDRHTFDQLAYHMGEASKNNLHIQLTRHAPGLIGALVDRQGRLHDAGQIFLDLAAQEWPRAPAHSVPLNLNDVMGRRVRASYAGKRVYIELTACDEMIYLVARKNGRNPLLTTQERQVCKHLVTGASYVKVARLLSISKSTVTKHVNRIYKKLGVKNKQELARCLAGQA